MPTHNARSDNVLETRDGLFSNNLSVFHLEAYSFLRPRQPLNFGFFIVYTLIHATQQMFRSNTITHFRLMC